MSIFNAICGLKILIFNAPGLQIPTNITLLVDSLSYTYNKRTRSYELHERIIVEKENNREIRKIRVRKIKTYTRANLFLKFILEIRKNTLFAKSKPIREIIDS